MGDWCCIHHPASKLDCEGLQSAYLSLIVGDQYLHLGQHDPSNSVEVITARSRIQPRARVGGSIDAFLLDFRGGYFGFASPTLDFMGGAMTTLLEVRLVAM